jgi:NTE family protein
VLITPDIAEYSTSNFNATDSLIVRGERAARLHYSELKALAESLRGFMPAQPQELPECPQPLPSFYVKEVTVNGLENTTEQFFLQKLELIFPAEITFAQLNKAVDRVNGTQVFLSIVYQLNPLPDGTVELQFDCVEQNTNMFRVGLHYDQDYKSALMFNLSMKNFLTSNSKINADLSIGANPYFSLSYLQGSGFRRVEKKSNKSGWSTDWLVHIDGYRLDADNYSGNLHTSAYTVWRLSPGIQLLFSHYVHSVLGIGFSGEYSDVLTRYANEGRDVHAKYQFLSYQFFYERDTYNEDYFPTKGCKYRLEGNYHKDFSTDVRYSDGWFGVLFRSNFVSTPVKRWSIHSGIDAGAVFGGDILPQYQIRLGGSPDRQLQNHINFTGMYFLQQYDKNVWVAHLNNQIRMWNNIYVTFRANLGKTGYEPSDLFTLKDFKIGYGVSMQYNTMVGPLGITLSSSNVTKGLLGAFHLGFWF